MGYRFCDLVDIDAFHSMLNAFYEATGILHGLVDIDNNVISAVGWQEACTKFHRAYPISNERCLKSNRYLTEHLGDAPFIGCKCENGLMDYASPIVIEGEQVATLYFGQILHEPPDMAYFRRQAQECGYDEEDYLASIRKVPILPRERVQPIMAFFSQLAQMLARSGLDHLRQREAEERLDELNRDLVQRVSERTSELAAKNRQLATDIALRQQVEVELRNNQAHLQAILDSSPVGIGWSQGGKIEYINKQFTEMFGYELWEIPTLDQWYRLAFPDDAYRNTVIADWEQQVVAARDTGVSAVVEVRIVCKDGSVRHVLVSESWVGNQRLGNFSDITDRWQAEQRNRAHNAILELIAKGASLTETLNALVRSVEAENPDMLCSIQLLDADGLHLRIGAAPSLPKFYNQAIDGLEIGDGVCCCGTCAYSQERVVVSAIQRCPSWAMYRDLAAQAGLAACWSEPVFSSKGRLLGTFAIYHRQPSEPDEADLSLIGQAANLASIAIEHHQVLKELEHRAHTDSLTDLSNHGYFLELAESELGRAVRYSRAFSVLLLDIDHFKAINDRYGHKSGDIVLQALAALMRRTLRDNDIIGRIGGEEFALLLPESDAKKALEAAERLRQVVAETEMLVSDSTRLGITISIGVATLAGTSDQIDDILRRADRALYKAKSGGRNRVCFADTV